MGNIFVPYWIAFRAQLLNRRCHVYRVPGDHGIREQIETPGLIRLLLLLLAFARFQLRFRGQPTVDSAWGKARLLASYAGFAAHPSQTTYEYAAMLGDAVPEAKSPIQDIAEARVHDRYTPAGASAEDVDRAVTGWRKLARTLVGMLPARLVSGIARIWR